VKFHDSAETRVTLLGSLTQNSKLCAQIAIGIQHIANAFSSNIYPIWRIEGRAVHVFNLGASHEDFWDTIWTSVRVRGERSASSPGCFTPTYHNYRTVGAYLQSTLHFLCTPNPLPIRPNGKNHR